MIRILYLICLLPSMLAEQFSQKQTGQYKSAKEDNNVISIILALIGIVVVGMEIIIYIREFRLKNVINFALFKSQVFAESDQKLGNAADSDIKARKTQQNQPQKIDEISKKQIGLQPEADIGQMSTKRKRKRKADRLSSRRDREIQSQSFESNDVKADEQY